MARRSLDPNTLLILAAIAGGGIALARVLNLGARAKDKLQDIGEAISSGLFDFFHPNAAGELLYYTVQFPDGKTHAVPSQSVNAAGQFTWRMDGKRYQLLVDKSKAAGVNKTAFLL